VSDRLRTARLVAVGLLAFALFNFPLLGVFDIDTRVAGIPLLWFYLFGAWLLVIGLLTWITRAR
jgi:hypothetical protein